MKKWPLIPCLLFLACSVWAQPALEQRVSLFAHDIPLENALLALADRSELSLSYSRELLPAKIVSVDFRQQPVRVILQALLTGTGLTYRMVGDQLVLFRQAPPAREQFFTVSGFLEDQDSGERLIAAGVYDRVSGRGTMTNEYGFYSLTLPRGRARLGFHYLGYQSEVRPLVLESDLRLNVGLRTSLVLSEVLVVAREDQEVTDRTPYNDDFITSSQIEDLPSLGGESDLIRATHLLPGVQTGADGVGGILVRGGNAGHNLILIDGVPVYNVLHAAGVFSVFNTSAVRSAKLIKGGFPARYAGRLSSVLDVRTKEGNMKETTGRVDLGLLSARFSLEGPIVTDKSSFFVSGRWSFLDQYIQPFSRNLKADRNEEGAISYQFYDLNAKLNYTFSERDKVYLSLYRGSDAFRNDGESSDDIFVRSGTTGEELNFRYDRSFSEGSDWGNTVSALRWNHLFGDKLFANTTLTFSQLGVNVNYRTIDSLVLVNEDTTLAQALDFGRYRSGIRDLGARIDFDYSSGGDHYLRFGAGVTNHRFSPGALVLEGSGLSPDLGDFLEEQLSGDAITTTEYSFYLEDDWQFNKRLSFNLGSHLAGWNVEGRTYWSLQPRLSAHWKAAPRLGLRAAFSTMTQFLHLLSNSGYGLPTDLWVPSTAEVGPQYALQWEAGLDYELFGHYTFSLDTYYKRMTDLLTYAEGANFLNDWENNVTMGEGRGYGLEVMLKRPVGRTRGWIAYSLARADRQFDRVNLGRRFPYRFDHRHSLKAVVSHRFLPWLKLTASWVYGSGLAYSLPLEEFTFSPPGGPSVPVLDFGEKNQFRIPPYHRLDLSFNMDYRTGKLAHSLEVGAYNVYNRKNPLYYNLRTSFVNTNGELRQTNEFVQVWLLPFLPSLNYSLQF